MPSVSRKQRTMACMALAMKKGKMEHSYSKAAHKMMGSMSEEELMKYCQTPMEKLPVKK